jgi:hypothetical protein
MAIVGTQLPSATEEKRFLHGPSDITMRNGVFCKANAEKLEVGSVIGQSLLVQRQSFLVE